MTLAMEGVEGSDPSPTVRAGPWGKGGRGSKVTECWELWCHTHHLVQREAALPVLGMRDLVTRAEELPEVLRRELLDLGPMISKFWDEGRREN